MATIDENVTSTISDHALRMLGCFVSGLDVVLYKIAEESARQRHEADQGGTVVAIEAQDVKRAAEFLSQRMKELVKEGHIPPDAEAAIDQMMQCCQRQAVEIEQ
jgi:hypothetical protein